VPPGPNVEPPLRRGDMTDSLRVLLKLSELSDRLTMLEIVGTRSCRAFFKKPGRNRITLFVGTVE